LIHDIYCWVPLIARRTLALDSMFNKRQTMLVSQHKQLINKNGSYAALSPWTTERRSEPLLSSASMRPGGSSRSLIG